ncbi:MAG TPA: hypothetical protein VM640_12010, partial [Desulfitobacterium sp.]|nr:hypothetical protein [Desulfitobacterium sp.]
SAPESAPASVGARTLPCVRPANASQFSPSLLAARLKASASVLATHSAATKLREKQAAETGWRHDVSKLAGSQDGDFASVSSERTA